MTQTLHIHLEKYSPGGRNGKHGHVDETAFYILDGAGYKIHGGVRYDWKAGDVAVAHANRMSQHFNADPLKPARALAVQSRPMYMFMTMPFQKRVVSRPSEPAPGAQGYEPRQLKDDCSHA